MCCIYCSTKCASCVVPNSEFCRTNVMRASAQMISYWRAHKYFKWFKHLFIWKITKNQFSRFFYPLGAGFEMVDLRKSWPLFSDRMALGYFAPNCIVSVYCSGYQPFKLFDLINLVGHLFLMFLVEYFACFSFVSSCINQNICVSPGLDLSHWHMFSSWHFDIYAMR